MEKKKMNCIIFLKKIFSMRGLKMQESSLPQKYKILLHGILSYK